MAPPKLRDVEAGQDAVIAVAPELRFLLHPRLRQLPGIPVRLDGTSTLLHLVESLGIPRTEIGGFAIAGRAAAPGLVPRGGERVRVDPVPRPQPAAGEGFLLDVGLGSLARALRVLGIDARYRNDAEDAALVAAATLTGRVLLTQDRGLLRRRSLARGALVRGQGRDAQLQDVLERFAPELRPWTRCPACNGAVAAVPKRDVAPDLPAGTRRSYEEFSRCSDCGKVYWHGAHAVPLCALVDTAREVVGRSRRAPPDGTGRSGGRTTRSTAGP